MNPATGERLYRAILLLVALCRSRVPEKEIHVCTRHCKTESDKTAGISGSLSFTRTQKTKSERNKSNGETSRRAGKAGKVT